MGRRGKPTHLRLVEGDKSRRGFKAARTEPVPPGHLSADEPPDWFNDDQRAAWKYGLEHAPIGLLRRLDGGIFAAWCVASVLHRRAAEKLNATDQLLLKTPNGSVQQTPFLGMVNRQALIMKALAAELGFSPAARTRVSVEEGAGVEDPADRYFGGA